MSKTSIAVVMICVFVVVLVGAFFFGTKTETVKLVSRHWYADRIIEDFQTRQYSGWDETVPADAFNRSESSRKRGESCTKIGKINSCTNRYDTWVTYSANRWARFETIQNEGTPSDTVSIPEPSVKCNGIAEIGCQRYAGYRITYRAQFDFNGTAFTCDYGKDIWQGLTDGQEYRMVFGLIRNEPRCGLEAVS